MARRILLLITDLERGGTPTVVRELATRLHHLPGCQVHVASLAPRGPVADEIERAGVATSALNATSALDVRVVGRLAGLLAREHIDTVLSFLVHSNVVAAAASLWGDAMCGPASARSSIKRDESEKPPLEAPAIPSAPSHGRLWIQSIQTTQPWPAWHWKAQWLVHRRASRVLVPTPSVAMAAHQWAGVPVSKIMVIPNAIEPADFAPSPSALAPPTPFPIGFIGRLDAVKRLPDLIDAMGMLTDLPIILHVFGEGRERPRIERQIAQNALLDRVILHGAIARPQAALEQVAALVLPSEAEGFGLVLIEAMASRVPLVATRVAGVRDVVTDESDGLLVPVRAPTALASAIRRLVKDPALRTRLTAAGAQTIAQRYTWASVLPLYKSLLDL